MYWLPSIVLQLKMLKLGQERFSPWLWVMIQSCSSILSSHEVVTIDIHHLPKRTVDPYCGE
mgnify:CR=1 FL=1